MPPRTLRPLAGREAPEEAMPSVSWCPSRCVSRSLQAGVGFPRQTRLAAQPLLLQPGIQTPEPQSNSWSRLALRGFRVCWGPLAFQIVTDLTSHSLIKIFQVRQLWILFRFFFFFCLMLRLQRWQRVRVLGHFDFSHVDKSGCEVGPRNSHRKR